MINTQPFQNFEQAAQHTITFLQQHFEFDLWMITRTRAPDWIVLKAGDRSYGVGEGAVLHWDDSLCSRMVRGEGPCIAPDARGIPVFRDAPIMRDLPIGAYVGLPLRLRNGELFGTLCAIDPRPMPASLETGLPLLQLICRLLTTTIQADLRESAEERRRDLAAAEARIDPITGLYDLQGWNDLLASEEQRCRRFGHAAYVMLFRLAQLGEVNATQGRIAGDWLLQRFAALLRAAAPDDVIARIGGEEFAVLVPECSDTTAARHRGSIMAALRNAGIESDFGAAMRNARSTLPAAYELARLQLDLDPI